MTGRDQGAGAYDDDFDYEPTPAERLEFRDLFDPPGDEVTDEILAFSVRRLAERLRAARRAAMSTVGDASPDGRPSVRAGHPAAASARPLRAGGHLGTGGVLLRLPSDPVWRRVGAYRQL